MRTGPPPPPSALRGVLGGIGAILAPFGIPTQRGKQRSPVSPHTPPSANGSSAATWLFPRTHTHRDRQAPAMSRQRPAHLPLTGRRTHTHSCRLLPAVRRATGMLTRLLPSPCGKASGARSPCGAAGPGVLGAGSPAERAPLRGGPRSWTVRDMVHGGCWDRLGHKEIERKLKRLTLVPVTRTISHRRDQSHPDRPPRPSPGIVVRSPLKEKEAGAEI
ncbi:uncharacterized protein ACIB01_000135 isoform 2-T2 [Guaruba guarouba]